MALAAGKLIFEANFRGYFMALCLFRREVKLRCVAFRMELDVVALYSFDRSKNLWKITSILNRRLLSLLELLIGQRHGMHVV